MLVASDPGWIQLLPALPAAWPAGAVEGALCRGQIEIERLEWSRGRILVALVSAREQSIVLSAPAAITEISVDRDPVKIQETGQKKSRRLWLQTAGEEVRPEIRLEVKE
jgi:alpha-L-fucosidase 2